MTESEQRQKLEEWLKTHPYGDQDENGIDIGSLRRNLRLTPLERIERHQKALASLKDLRRLRS